jgi:hypothetical protein
MLLSDMSPVIILPRKSLSGIFAMLEAAKEPFGF